ncbi:MAG: esterase-like activity of phytase family protein [Prochlorococcaceae cyanobacterium]
MNLLCRAGTVLTALLAFSPGARAAGGPALLPCPLEAGWRLERQLELPRRAPDGREVGGFSAVQLDPATNQLLLLSDATEGALLRWSRLEERGIPRLLEVLPLHRPMDGEGLVVLNGQFWVASEGRRTAERPAQLLRFEAGSGRLLEALSLPAAWQPGPGTGLASNGGPESLLLLPPAAGGGPAALLMAAEQPLLQDPPDAVRLLRWQWPAGTDPHTATPTPLPQGALRLPETGWGLTDLLAVEPGRLLALKRRFEAPRSWRIRLALYSLPPPAADATGEQAASQPLEPLAVWDLIAAGLAPDNWEGLSPGPPLADGRPTLLLASDDNFNPLQANRLALLTPIRADPCPAQP